jgi:hypothetical protein
VAVSVNDTLDGVVSKPTAAALYEFLETALKHDASRPSVLIVPEPIVRTLELELEKLRRDEKESTK